MWTYDPDRGFPGLVPELRYRDVEEAVAWLTTTMGFRVLLRHSPDGVKLAHVDMSTGKGIVMLGGLEADDGPPAPGAPVAQYVVYVDDVDAHAAHARAAGAQLETEPVTKPWGLRQYLIRDPGGHLWEPTQHVEDVPPEAWGAEVVDDDGWCHSVVATQVARGRRCCGA